MRYTQREERLTKWVGASLTFLLSVVTYWVTMERGASFWDCPEYIVTATALEIGHPPGNPVWSMAMRVATSIFPAGMEAIAINACSGLLTGGAAAFLFLIIYAAVSHVWNATPTVRLLVSLAGALSFAWCDSTWFSAVEAEVYAMSIFMTALMVWLMVVWCRCHGTPRGDRLLVLIAYLTGLSLGVHQLNLLVIPVLALMWVYVNNPADSTPPRRVIARGLLGVLLSFAAIALVLAGLMPGLLWGAAQMELLTVNGFGWPYHSGTILFAALLLLLFILLTIFVRGRRAGLCVWMAAMICLGFSSFAFIIIRSAAMPPMNEGVPADIFALQSYLARDQYGSKPLLKGVTPFSKPMLEERTGADGKPDYTRYHLVKEKPTYVAYRENASLSPRSGMLSHDDSLANERVRNARHGYYLSDYRYKYAYPPELDMWFPRITSGTGADLDAYRSWVGMSLDNMTKVEISEVVDTTGNPAGKMGADGKRRKRVERRPTYMQNLQFFLGYQVYYMYVRYLLWNFCGRQNDICSSGEVDHGNFITGFTAIDNLMLGAEDELPCELGQGNRGRNVYYCLPFLFGIAGIVWLCCRGRRGRRVCTLVLLLFLMTGVAIVVYLNQGPGEPRERDYSFLGSYMAFAIWISFGAVVLVSMSRWMVSRAGGSEKGCVRGETVAALLSLGVPGLMFAENFDDHDRRGRSAVEDFSRNILQSQPQDAILVVAGDNYTFPMWYAQETLGVRPDVTVVNGNYLALPSYYSSLMQPTAGGDGLRSQARLADILYGRYAYVRISADADTSVVELRDALRELFRDTVGSAELRHRMVRIAGSAGDSVVIDLGKVASELGRSSLPFSTLAMLDIVGSNVSAGGKERPVVFRNGVSRQLWGPFDDALREWPYGRIYWPSASDSLLVERVFEGVMSMRDGGFGFNIDGRYPYCDETTGYMLRRERVAMMCAAAMMLENGEASMARAVIERTREVYPEEGCAYGRFVRDGVYKDERSEYSRLLRKVAAELRDDTLLKWAVEMERGISERRREYRRYYRSLPPGLRDVTSDETRSLLKDNDGKMP